MATTRKGMTSEELESFIQKLDDMPVKKKTIFSNREIATQHRERILNFMEEKGYSFQDVAEMMAEGENAITGGTLASYLRGDKVKASVKKTRKAAPPRKTPSTYEVEPDKDIDTPEFPSSHETDTQTLRENFERRIATDVAGS